MAKTMPKTKVNMNLDSYNIIIAIYTKHGKEAALDSRVGAGNYAVGF